MKKILSLVLASGLLLAGCGEFDDSKILSELDSHAARIKSLEEQCSKLNTNIGSMQSILDALKDNDYVKSVTPITEGGKTVGYTIAFTKSGSVTIYHGSDGANGKDGADGKTPVIGVRAGTDGLYYWTIDGSWLLDGSGDKVAATGPKGDQGAPGTPGSNGKDGVSPKLKIEGGFWFVSYDGGSSWTKLYAAQGEPGDSFFSEVSVGGDTVVFTLSDGTKFTLPMASSAPIAFLSTDDQTISAGNNLVVAKVNAELGAVKSIYASIDTYEAAYTRSAGGWSASLAVDETAKTVTATITPDASVHKVLLTLTLVLTDGSSHSTSKVLVSTGGVIDPAAVDLSTGGTANCYVVSATGAYKFPTVKGNSSESVGQVAYAEVLWESFGTAVVPAVGTLVDNVACSDGFISFSTMQAQSLVEGNAVIAAKDASGKILWSWHIWLTDKPKDQVYFNNAGTMMDRNLGATATEPTYVQSGGLFYQWGRKDPFLGTSKRKEDFLAVSTNNSIWNTIPSSQTTGTIDYATAHPTTFITTVNYGDWYTNPTPSLPASTRWQTTKTIYDPCPPGYRVPESRSSRDPGVWTTAMPQVGDDEIDLFWRYERAVNFGDKKRKHRLCSDNYCWYDAAGKLNYKDGTPKYVGTEGYYWSCCLKDTPGNLSAYILFFYDMEDGNCEITFSSDCAANGFSVRCQKL